MRSSKGFTLVELMLAFVILTFGIVSVLRSFGMAVTAIRKADDTKVLSWLMESEMEALIRRSREEMGIPQGVTTGELGMEDGNVYSWKLAVVPSSVSSNLSEATLLLAKTSGRRAELTATTYLFKREEDEQK